MSDDESLDKKGFKFHAGQFKAMSNLIAVAKTRLANFLRENGIPVLPSEDDEIARVAVEEFKKQMEKS